MSCYSAWNTLWNSQSPCKPQPIQHIFDFQIVYISRSFQVMLYVFEIIAVSLTSSWWTCTAYYNILIYAFFLQKQDSSRLTTWWIHLMFEIDLNCTLSFPAMLSKKRMRRTQKIFLSLLNYYVSTCNAYWLEEIRSSIQCNLNIRMLSNSSSINWIT